MSTIRAEVRATRELLHRLQAAERTQQHIVNAVDGRVGYTPAYQERQRSDLNRLTKAVARVWAALESLEAP